MRFLPRESEHGWTPYLWLIYVGPYVVFPFLAQTITFLGSRSLFLAAWALGLALFLLLYFRSYWLDGSPRLTMVVGLAALGAALSPLNPGAVMFFVYAAGFVGGAARPAHAGYWIGATTVAGVLCALTSPWEPYLMVSGVAIMAPLIGFVNLHYSETRRRDAALKLAHDEVARLAAVAERERIAADLHDLLGHTLSVIVLKAELASKLMTRDPGRAAAEMAEVERVSRDALTEVRRAVHGYRAASLADEVVRAKAVLQTAGVAADIDASALDASSGNWPAAPEVEHAAAMVLREAVTNVIRHARATHCSIDAHIREGQLVVRVTDDGVGGPVREGVGVDSMRARAREIGGTLEHHGRSSRGVVVTFRAPVSRPT